MKAFLPLALCAVAVSACQCQPGAPTAVTFRIRNDSSSPLFVDATDGRMGLHVKRNVAGQWLPFVEQPACECQTCDQICGCICDEETRQRVLKVDPDSTFERTWTGYVQVSGIRSCSVLEPGRDCLTPEIPSVDETFHLELCYAPSSQGANDADAGVAVPGTLPEASVSCVEKPFQIRDGLVEISPSHGAPCTTHADCQNPDELCFAGSCTTACPATGFPPIGASWRVAVAEPEDRGFFVYTGGPGRQGWDGMGLVSSVTYANNTMSVFLRPDAPGSKVNGRIDITLPEGVAVPLESGERISVHIVDLSTEENPENRAVTLRDGDGTLLLAADTAQGGAILEGAELAPFAVSRVDTIVGCEHTECGKNLFHATRFAAVNEAVEVKPGDAVALVADGAAWTLVNVGNQRYGADTFCTLSDLMPYVIANQRNSP
ncbi:MAG: hypothetical protein IRZ16_03655 [Myxococcaceae bacterium]|nr:hypothetical protein [Myxococcaceae bacterium]